MRINRNLLTLHHGTDFGHRLRTQTLRHSRNGHFTDYCQREEVDEIVIGLPRQLNGEDSESMRYIRPFMARLPQLLPGMKVTQYDERFTSSLAHRAMIEAGLKQSTRRQKPLADRTAAVILLTDYLESRR